MGQKKRQAKPNSVFFRGKATIVGRVTSARAGKPIAGAEARARIEIVDKSKGWPACAEAEAEVTTDDRGCYEIKVPGLRKLDEAKFYTYFVVSADAARSVPEQIMPARRESDQPRAGKRLKVNFKLDPAFAVAGRVVDEKGSPVEAVEVVVYQSSSYGCCNPMLVGGDWPKTDANGEFLADGMPMGLSAEQRQTAGFFHPDFQRCFVQRIGDLPRGKNRTACLDDVILRRGLRLSGAVRNTRGKPVAGANVLVMAEDPYQGDPGCARPPAKWGMKTGADGRYVANGLAPMIYNVFVAHPSLPPGTKMGVNLMTRSQAGVDVVLDKAAGVLAGTVTRADGSPAAGVKLEIEQYLTQVNQTTTTNKRGQYRLAGFAPHLGVTFEGVSDLDDLAWFDPPNLRADIRLPELLTVTGRLVDVRTGQPLGGTKRLRLTKNPSWGGRGPIVESNPRSGTFEMPGVWPGPYFLCVRSNPDTVICRELKVTAARADLGDVPIHAGVTLQGKVLTPSGRPIPRADVFVDSPQYYDGKSARTDSQGRYSFKGLSDGSHQFRIRADGWAPFYLQELDLPGEGGRFVNNVRMAKGVSVTGRVTDGDKPITRQIVILSARQPRGQRVKRPWIADTNTDDTGCFCFPNIRPGKYAIRCGLEERNITIKPDQAMKFNFRWPGRYIPGPHQSKGGHAI